MNGDRGLDPTGTTLANGVDTHVPRWLRRPTPGGRCLNRLNRCIHGTVRRLRSGRQHRQPAGAFKGEVTMRRVGFLMIILALAAGCGDDDNPNSPSSGPIQFTAQLSPANEVPPIQGAEAGGRGFVIITFNVPRDNSGAVTGAGTATFEIQTASFPDGSQAVAALFDVLILGVALAVAAHIHPGEFGRNGGVLVTTGLTPGDPIDLGPNSVTRTLTATVTQVDATNIVANPGAYYFNVHTSRNGGGVMRGQLIRQ